MQTKWNDVFTTSGKKQQQQQQLTCSLDNDAGYHKQT
jgi:hypothetical protein